jgi:CobQ-like glutamine amidotransferase family enzyme
MLENKQLRAVYILHNEDRVVESDGCDKQYMGETVDVYRILLGEHFRRRPRGLRMSLEDNIKIVCGCTSLVDLGRLFSFLIGTQSV